MFSISVAKPLDEGINQARVILLCLCSISWFSRPLYSILPFDSVVTCPPCHLTFMIFRAEHIREISMRSHRSPQLSPLYDTP